MSDATKVLVVIGQLEIGGAERHLVNVLPAVHCQALSCTVYALRGGGALEGELQAAGIRVISPRHHSRRWIGLLRTAWHVIATLRHERPDIVHFFLPEAYLLGGLCSLFAPRCIRIMSRRSLNHYQHKRRMIPAIERFLHRRMDCILANSNAVLNELRREGVAESASGVIYNGVRLPSHTDSDAGVATRKRLEIADGTFVLVMVANLIPYKGHGEVIEALRLAHDRLPDEWMILMIGSNRGIQADLEQRAVAGGVANNIRWLGQLDDVQPYLAIADLALVVSHEEGFSNAVLEAMAASLALVVTAVGGNVEAVVDGESGCVVPPRDAPSIAEAIVELAGNGVKRSLLGQAARARVVSHFGMENCVAAYRRVYLGLAGRSNRTIKALIAECGAISTDPPPVQAGKPKVLFVVTEDWYFVSHRLALACRIRDAGYRVTVATRIGNLEDTIREKGLELAGVPFERSLRHPLRDLRALLALNRVFEREQPDIVHLVSLKPIVLGAVLLAVVHRRTRAVWAFTGMGYIFSSAGMLARALRPVITRLLGWLNDAERFRMVVQNVEDASVLRKYRVARPECVSIIPGAGLDTSEFYPHEGNPDGATPVVLLPARLLQDKGIYEFAAAASIVREQGIAARFVLVGRFDHDNHGTIDAADLERWIADKRLEWWGHRDNMREVYHAASVVCLPSYREGLPKVLLEAGACGIPLIASDVSGCRAVCIDNETGLLVPVRDSAALAAAVMRVLADPALAERLGQAARERIEDQFAVEGISAQTVALYRELLDGRSVAARR
jgi:glycosyltransferase involved in cell wall biosynthesis